MVHMNIRTGTLKEFHVETVVMKFYKYTYLQYLKTALKLMHIKTGEY